MKFFMNFLDQVNECEEVIALSIFTIVPGIAILLLMYAVGYLQSMTGATVFEHKLPEGAPGLQVAAPIHIPTSTFASAPQSPLDSSFMQVPSNPAHFGRPRQMSYGQPNLAGLAGAAEQLH